MTEHPVLEANCCNQKRNSDRDILTCQAYHRILLKPKAWMAYELGKSYLIEGSNSQHLKDEYMRTLWGKMHVPKGKNLELLSLTIFVTFHSTSRLVNKARSLDYYKVSWYGSWHWSTWRTTFRSQLFKATKRTHFCCLRCSNPACTIGQN